MRININVRQFKKNKTKIRMRAHISHCVFIRHRKLQQPTLKQQPVSEFRRNKKLNDRACANRRQEAILTHAPSHISHNTYKPEFKQQQPEYACRQGKTGSCAYAGVSVLYGRPGGKILWHSAQVPTFLSSS